MIGNWFYYLKINNVYPKWKWSEIESVCNMKPAGYHSKYMASNGVSSNCGELTKM